MEIYMEYNIIESKMEDRIQYLREELSKIRAGRANPQILNKVMVEYYGTLTPINQVAAISVPEARQILVSPWEKSLLGTIEKAINQAELGINPMNDGSSIRLNFPELNEQRRKDLVKDIKGLGEETKIAIRNVRRDSIEAAKKLEKEKVISEDELRGSEAKIQIITDKYISKIDDILESKEKEIMEI